MPLIVEITGIGCYKDTRTFTFEQGVSLLHGETGCGKSSVFKAIDWCLYGKLRGIYNSQTTQSKVIIKIVDLTIIRERGRNKLTVFSASHKQPHIGEAAQHMICKFFGTHDRWSSSSYVVQGERNILFALSKIDKAKTLTWCEGIKPASVIAALKDTERSKINKYQENQGQLNSEYTVCDRTGVPVSRETIVDINQLNPAANLEALKQDIKMLIDKKERSKLLTGKIDDLRKLYDTSFQRLLSYQDAIRNVLTKCGLEEDSLKTVTRDVIQDIIIESHIKIILNKYISTQYERQFDSILNATEVEMPVYSIEDIHQLKVQEDRWNCYTSLVNDWNVFGRRIETSVEILPTMRQYVEMYELTLQHDELMRSVKVLGSLCPMPLTLKDVEIIESLINAFETLGVKPSPHPDVVGFKRYYSLSRSKLIQLTERSVNIMNIKSLTYREYDPREYDHQLYSRWTKYQDRNELKSRIVRGYMPESIRRNAYSIYHNYQEFQRFSGNHTNPDEFLRSMRDGLFLGMTIPDSDQKLSTVGKKYLELVVKFGVDGSKPSILDINDSSEVIISIIHSLLFIRSFEDIAQLPMVDQEQYDRLVSIYHIIHDLKQLPLTQHDIEKEKEQMKVIPYTCDECGYQNIENQQDVQMNLVERYIRWKFLNTKLTDMNVTNDEISKLNNGLSNLSSELSRSKKVKSLTLEYQSNCDTISHMTITHGQVLIDNLRLCLNSISPSMIDAFKRTIKTWSTLISSVKPQGIPILHTNNDELRSLKFNIQMLEYAETLESLNWSSFDNLRSYRSQNEIMNDIQVSEVLDKLRASEGEDIQDVQLSTTQLSSFEMFRHSKLTISAVKELHDESLILQAEALIWNELFSVGLTPFDISTYKSMMGEISLQYILKIINLEEKYEEDLRVWIEKTNRIESDSVIDVSRLKTLDCLNDIRSDIFSVKKALKLKSRTLKNIIGNHDEMIAKIKRVFPVIDQNGQNDLSVNQPSITPDVANDINSLATFVTRKSKSGFKGSITVNSMDSLILLENNLENLAQLSLYVTKEIDASIQLLERIRRIGEKLKQNGYGDVDLIVLKVDQAKRQLEEACKENFKIECYHRVHAHQQIVVNSYNETVKHVGLRETVEHLKDRFDIQFINQLNIEVGRIIERLFNTDFHLTVDAVKESKSTGNIRHEIGFTIKTNGRDTDIKGISGGEADRVSLALTIALANIWNMKFIMIDESMKSLDDETRRSCIQVLKETGKICICISHSDIAGMYDHEIQL